MAIRSLGGYLYAFDFANVRCLENVIAEAPFIVSKLCFNLMKWPEGVPVDEIDFSRIPVWIQIHRIPIDMMSKENGIIIG